MTRRAGLIDTQTSVVQSPNLGSGAAHPATIQAYDDLAKAARSIGDLVQPAVDANTEKEARAAVARGDFTPSGDVTRQDQIYNKIIDAGFVAKASIDVDRMVGELENKHLPSLNMEEFAKDNDAARTLYLQNTDPRHAPSLAQAWDQRALNAQQRLSNLAVQKGVKMASESMAARAEQLSNEVGGASDPHKFDIAWRLAELKSLQTGRVAAGFVSEAEANAQYDAIFSRIQANGASDFALKHYAENGYSDQAYDEALKMADDALSSPQLSLTPEKRSAMLSSVRTSLNAQRAELKAQERERKAEIRELQREALDEFKFAYDDAKTLVGAGSAVSVEKLNDLYTWANSSRNPRLYRSMVDELALTSEINQRMRSFSIPEQEKAVQDLEQAAAAGDVTAARQLEAARAVASNARRAAEADPAGYQALRLKRDPPQIDWTSSEGSISTMASRFGEAVDAAKDLGVGAKFFSPADRVKLKAIADTGGVDALKAVNVIVQAADRAGVDPLRIMSEIDNEGAPLMAIAGRIISGGGDQQVAAKLLTGKAAFGNELVKKQMPKASEQKRVQLQMLGHVTSQMTPAQVDAYTRAFDSYLASDILSNDGVRRENGYELAARAVIGESTDASGRRWGGLTKYKDQTVTVPPWMSTAQFGQTLPNLTETDLKRSVGPLTTFTPTLGTYKGRPATVADYRSAALVEIPPLGSGMYYVAPDPKKPREFIDLNGAYAILNLNAIRGDLKTRFASTVR